MSIHKNARLLLPLLLCMLVAIPPLYGTDQTIPWARIFASGNGSYGFTVVIDLSLQGVGVRGCLFRLDHTGQEQIVWRRPLDFVPGQVLVSNQGHVVAIDQYPDLDTMHALAVFDRSGEVLADYSREDLPTGDGPVGTPGALQTWDKGASFSFEYAVWPERRAHFVATLRNGRLISVDLSTGRVFPGSPGHIAARGWPSQVAGRKLQGVTKHYALYANDAAEGARLGQWVDSELSEVSTQFELPSGRGLILAIEAQEESVAALARWRRENISRARVIDWKSDRVQRFGYRESFSGDAGRPYCLGDGVGVYFTESYAVPYAKLQDIQAVDRTIIKPTWVCLLTTDSHVRAAFDAGVREGRREGAKLAREVVRKHPSQVGAYLLFSFVGDFIASCWRSIDERLMRLQRREVLWETLIGHSAVSAEARRAALDRLRSETDEVWKQLYLSRPQD